MMSAQMSRKFAFIICRSGSPFKVFGPRPSVRTRWRGPCLSTKNPPSKVELQRSPTFGCKNSQRISYTRRVPGTRLLSLSIALRILSARADSMCCRSTSIACMSKIVGALVRCKRFYEFSNQSPEFLHGALGAFAQRSFEFRERHLDGIEVWRICRQIAECCTDSVDCLAYPVDLVGPQIIREHDVAFCQRWREHLLDIGHERGSIHRTIDDIRCSQAVDAQARNERQ